MINAALFIPCYVDQFYPHVGLATLELLERYGVRVEYPQAQTCCGQPVFNSGSFDVAKPIADKFLEVFSSYQYIVCPSGSCTSMVRNHYAELVPDRIAELRSKTFELCEFLHDVLGVKPEGRFPHRVGLHASCHGLRELRLGSGSERRVQPFDKVRSLLSGLEGIQFADLSRKDECCGFGGTFAVGEEAVSVAMGNGRIADHERGGAEIITGGDMSCLMHLDGLLRRQKKPIRVMHVAEILAEATANE
ncbi:(Fe-S)-binding protein [Pendulispora brunnea]|uniref:(Fe-S)-binding protein n=1 Tax=Pendulispora brunnea TaxID=2905690 RepID=A0ABZ2JWG5_9BACT